MTKEFYQILEIGENATQEEIKNAYRKLATKWHPDRNKSPEATKKMQEINKAYEVLGNEEKKKKYDLGTTDFAFEASEFNYSYEEGLESIRDELEKAKEEEKILARKEVINIVGFEMLITEIYPRQLDSNLWTPYSRWQEKVWKIPIKSNPRGVMGIDTSELDKFKETMINAIRKRKEEWKTGINNPYFDKTKSNAIEAIEEAMKEKRLKVEDLGEYSNYKEQINNLDRQWKIRNLKDKVVVFIKSMGDNKESEKSEKNSRSFLDGASNSSEYSKDKEETQGQIRKTPKQDKAPIESEKKFISPKKTGTSGEYSGWDRESLIKKIEELEAEIRELKQEEEDVPEFKEYIAKKESELLESKRVLENFSSSNPNPNLSSPNFNFPTSLIVALAVLLVAGLIAVLVVSSRKKKN